MGEAWEDSSGVNFGKRFDLQLCAGGNDGV